MSGGRRETIIMAATRIFSKYGFHGAKMDNIAKEAGIGKGTIYGYFDSKEALFYEMIKHGVEEYEQGLHKAFKREGSFKEKLTAMCKFHGTYIKKYIGITQVIIMEKGILSKECINDIVYEKDRLVNIIKEAVIRAMEGGELRQDLDPDLATILILGTISQFYGDRILKERDSIENLVPNKLLDYILEGLQ